ncbi:unnamed protein product, partial [Urochloa humidicola]
RGRGGASQGCGVGGAAGVGNQGAARPGPWQALGRPGVGSPGSAAVQVRARPAMRPSSPAARGQGAARRAWQEHGQASRGTSEPWRWCPVQVQVQVHQEEGEGEEKEGKILVQLKQEQKVLQDEEEEEEEEQEGDWLPC